MDGTLWRTLRLVFVRPGRLSLEYAAGRRRPYVNPFRLLLIAIVAYALMTSSGLVAFWNIGGVTVSMAPAAIRRNLSVETTLEQVDRYGLVLVLFGLWQFGYLAVAIRRSYLTTGRWGGRLLSVAAAMLLYVVNAVFMTAVQVGGAAIAIALA